MGTRYKCLIVDDEKPAHLVLQSHISHCEELECGGCATNGKEAIRELLENEYDVVFLDIEMPLINGIEVMQTIPKRPATIITTAYDNFAFDAYQHDAVDYLLKPISFPRFLKAIEKAKLFTKSRIEKSISNTSINLRINGDMRTIAFADILYFQSIGNYVKVYFAEKNKNEVVYDSLKNMLDKTASDTFVQTHKSYIVNKEYIQSIEKDCVLLHGGVSIPIGRKFELLVLKSIV